jgi:hypothetical protein
MMIDDWRENFGLQYSTTTVDVCYSVREKQFQRDLI